MQIFAPRLWGNRSMCVYDEIIQTVEISRSLIHNESAKSQCKKMKPLFNRISFVNCFQAKLCKVTAKQNTFKIKFYFWLNSIESFKSKFNEWGIPHFGHVMSKWQT